MKWLLGVIVLLLMLGITSCGASEGPPGPAGPPGIAGAPGLAAPSEPKALPQVWLSCGSKHNERTVFLPGGNLIIGKIEGEWVLWYKHPESAQNCRMPNGEILISPSDFVVFRGGQLLSTPPSLQSQ